MDYEKKYKEALERAKDIYTYYCDDRHQLRKIECIFPELKEGDDERIREEILEYFQQFENEELRGVNISDWIAWLEKQGEQKSITFNNARLIDSALNDYCCKIYNALHKENGGVLSFARLQHLAMDIYGWCKGQIEQKPAWSEEDEMRALSIEQVMNCAALLNIVPEKIDKIRTWLRTLKNRVGCEANCTTTKEWGEEDKNMLEDTIYMVTMQRDENRSDNEYQRAEKCIDWLKSLKERYTWKPSDEQMKVCKEVYADLLSAKGFDVGTINSELNRLEEQLKKLREK